MPELLTSGPGTGKTSYCIDLFRQEVLKSKSGIDSRSFFILPNREHRDRIQSLILKKDVTGLFNAHILTINDFTSHQLGLVSGSFPTDTQRLNVLREILEAPPPGGWEYFGEAGSLSGFHRLLVDLIKEFKASLLSVRDFEKHAQPLLKDRAFRSKFRDFSVLVKNYEKRLNALGLKEPEDSTALFLKNVKKMPPAQLIIFDGFYHFTAAQLSVLEALSRWSRHTVVTLTVPDRKRPHVFEYPQRTRDFLLRSGFREKKDFASANRRTSDRTLRHLEKNIFLEKPGVLKAAPEPFTIFEADHPRVEIEMIARRIRRLYREKDLHYSEICLILRKIGGYERLIESIFRRYAIPTFVHERKKLIEDGLVRTLYRFLSLLRDGWKRDDLFFVLKSSFLAPRVLLSDLVNFEAAVIRDNIKEGREEWLAAAQDRDCPVSVAALLGQLLDFEARIASAASSSDFSEGILKVVRFLKERPDTENVSGEEEARVLATVEGLLRRAGDHYKNKKGELFSPPDLLADFQKALELGLFSVRPRGKNFVQIYDVVMALPKEYKVVFIAGLTEKNFPQAVAEDPFFKDAERKAINGKRMILEERLPRATGERYFFYMALTRATERVVLSYPRHDFQGKPVLRSFFIEETERCLRGVPRERGRRLPEPSEWETASEASRGFAAWLREFSPETADPWLPGVLNAWLRKPSFREALADGREKEAVLKDPAVLERFREWKEAFSATQLERYATCAFKFFAYDVLSLNESLEGRENLEMGNLLHQTLEAFYVSLADAERAGGGYASDAALWKGALKKILGSLMEKGPFKNEPLYRQRLYLFSMHQMLDRSVDHEIKLLKERSLRPAYFELAFGGKRGGLDYLRIPDSGKEILFRGKIDRIDLTDDKKQALVIDYKRSRRELHADLEKGLEFQLPIYILAARNLLGVNVLGAEHRILKEGKASGLYDKTAQPFLPLQAKKGVYDTREFGEKLASIEALIRHHVKRIRQGHIAVRSKSCEYCPYDSVCRFEKWKLIYDA